MSFIRLNEQNTYYSSLDVVGEEACSGKPNSLLVFHIIMVMVEEWYSSAEKMLSWSISTRQQSIRHNSSSLSCAKDTVQTVCQWKNIVNQCYIIEQSELGVTHISFLIKTYQSKFLTALDESRSSCATVNSFYIRYSSLYFIIELQLIELNST